MDGQAYPGEFVPAASGPATSPLALPAAALVELEIENQSAVWQPLHLHGYRFRLLVAGARTRAPWKDTVAVAPRSSVKIELLADQPGRWLLPSANLYRAQSGLARLLAVG